MKDMLQEYCDSRGVAMRVDRHAGIIRGVKVLGLKSRNGRTYLPEALAQAARLYEDAKVNVNHPRGNPGGPRDYRDRIGAIRSVVVRPGEGLFADFQFNPKHALAEQLAWDAEHSPENVGFSHNVEARCVRRGDCVVVEAITRVQSVDLVADPATTRGLFESKPDQSEGAAAKPVKSEESPDPDNAAQKNPELAEGLDREQADELHSLREELKRFRAADALLRKRDAARRLLREFDLPDVEAADPLSKTVGSERFLELLLAAPDEQVMREMVEERAQLVRTLTDVETRPRSKDQHLVYAAVPSNAKSFVEAIT